MKKTGIDLIAAERQRQIESEGWTAEHDARHEDDDLALAAVCYALPNYLRRWPEHLYAPWPWALTWWKPSPDDRKRELQKAGALIAAELDRLIALESDRNG